MPVNPSGKVRSQLQSQMGMARIGGGASKASKKIPSDKGSSFAALENTLLKNGLKNRMDVSKASSQGPTGSQFAKGAGESYTGTS